MLFKSQNAHISQIFSYGKNLYKRKHMAEYILLLPSVLCDICIAKLG